MTGLWKAIGAILAIVICLAMLVSALQPPDPNARMAKTAREAVEMAQDAREDATYARRRGYALRVVALVAGVSAPLVVAYLIYRASQRSEPRAEDVLEVMEEEGLTGDGSHGTPGLRSQKYLDDRRGDTLQPPQDDD